MHKSQGLGLLLQIRKSGERGACSCGTPERAHGVARAQRPDPRGGRGRPRWLQLRGGRDSGSRIRARGPAAVTLPLPSCSVLFPPLSIARIIFCRARHLALAHTDAGPREAPAHSHSLAPSSRGSSPVARRFRPWHRRVSSANVAPSLPHTPPDRHGKCHTQDPAPRQHPTVPH